MDSREFLQNCVRRQGVPWKTSEGWWLCPRHQWAGCPRSPRPGLPDGRHRDALGAAHFLICLSVPKRPRERQGTGRGEGSDPLSTFTSQTSWRTSGFL